MWPFEMCRLLISGQQPYNQLIMTERKTRSSSLNKFASVVCLLSWIMCGAAYYWYFVSQDSISRESMVLMMLVGIFANVVSIIGGIVAWVIEKRMPFWLVLNLALAGLCVLSVWI